MPQWNFISEIQHCTLIYNFTNTREIRYKNAWMKHIFFWLRLIGDGVKRFLLVLCWLLSIHLLLENVGKSQAEIIYTKLNYHLFGFAVHCMNLTAQIYKLCLKVLCKSIMIYSTNSEFSVMLEISYTSTSIKITNKHHEMYHFSLYSSQNWISALEKTWWLPLTWSFLVFLFTSNFGSSIF